MPNAGLNSKPVPSKGRVRVWLSQSGTWWVLLAVGLLPLAWLVMQTLQEQLGPNPAETLIRALGDWTLRGLCLTLAVTPVRTVMGWPELVRFRRMFGVLTFGYACLHLLGYAWFDMGFEWADIAKDIAKRPFILVGFVAFVAMSALAATSFNRAIRWMGAQRWKALHRLVYAVAVLAIVHFWWMRAGKQNFAEVMVYAAILTALLGWRVWRRWGVKPHKA